MDPKKINECNYQKQQTKTSLSHQIPRHSMNLIKWEDGRPTSSHFIQDH